MQTNENYRRRISFLFSFTLGFLLLPFADRAPAGDFS
jgi:hypothetical protein